MNKVVNLKAGAKANDGEVQINFVGQEKINMYDEHPRTTISLHEFYQTALNRLQLLRKIEFMNDANKGDDDLAREINIFAKQRQLAFEGVIDPKDRTKLTKLGQEDYTTYRLNDTISHFICRLAYCRTEELKKWFLTQETRFFALRIKMLENKEVKTLLNKHLDIHYEALKPTDSEWVTYREQITFKSGSEGEKPEDYLKVPFKEALPLIAKRQVFLLKGIAFVPITQLQQIACNHFRFKLSLELTKASKNLPLILKDQRIQSMLLALSNHNAIDFNIYEVKAPSDSDKINLAELDYHARLSFPPCMKALHQVLKQQHHLKHYGRLQLGLFLKGIGLTMDESLRYWKQEFTKKNDIDADKFEKNYAYNIRHSYGAEGKRNDYRPWNCNKTINLTAPGNGEYHGCPFKTFSEDNLVQLLSAYGLQKQDMAIVMDKKRENLYQVACLRLFEATHKNSIADNVGNHPNAYFTSSRQFAKDSAGKEKQA